MRETNSWRWKLSALMGFLAVALGAFGAHGLQDLLIVHEAVEQWKTASFYLLAHGPVLLFLAPSPDRTWSLFFFGVLIFSGSLYLLALTDQSWFGATTPIGGVLLLLGWGSLIFKASWPPKT